VATASEIETKVRDFLAGDYDVQETKTIPSPEDVHFGKLAKKMNLCVFYIDLRRSTDLLFSHQKQTAGKIHKAFLHTVASVVLNNGGYIRSFKGDSLMAFWPANYKTEIGSAVKAAMQVKWVLAEKLKPLFAAYEEIDFGIGIDWGEVYILRAGIPRDANNNDLIFMGKCVNFAVAIGDQAKGPNHIEISQITYENLLDDVRYGKTKEGEQVDMWKECSVQWKGEKRPTRCTTWHWRFD
jgi:adenylate cyclase